MIDLEKVIKGLRDIDMFIAGRLGYEQAKNFLHTIDEAVVLLKEHGEQLATMRMIYGTDAKIVGEIVRCKECRYGQKCTDGKTTFQCFKWNSAEFGALHEQDWYCADGVKRE